MYYKSDMKNGKEPLKFVKILVRVLLQLVGSNKISYEIIGASSA